MVILWLDDMRNPFDPQANWVHRTMGVKRFAPGTTVIWCKDYNGFVEQVTEQMPDVICFDHDLGMGYSGKDAANWLCAWCLDRNIPLPAFYSQSSNPVGREAILSLLSQFKKYQESLTKTNI